jgi:SulP family sulfate permease
VLSPADVVVLHVYGSLFFGSAATFVEQLPVADDNSRGASVIIRLRGADDLGSTVIQALLRYKSELEAAHCYLLISGVGEELMRQLVSTGAIGELDRTRVFSATKVVGESLAAAIEHARELAKRAGGSP